MTNLSLFKGYISRGSEIKLVKHFLFRSSGQPKVAFVGAEILWIRSGLLTTTFKWLFAKGSDE